MLYDFLKMDCVSFKCKAIINGCKSLNQWICGAENDLKKVKSSLA